MNPILRCSLVAVLSHTLIHCGFFSSSQAQCTIAPFGQWPESVIIPRCDGSKELISKSSWTGEYSVIAVKQGVAYTFTSSSTSDLLTIADSATEPLAFGKGSAALIPEFTGTVRLYRHISDQCETADDQFRSIHVVGQHLYTPKEEISFYFGEIIRKENYETLSNQIFIPVYATGCSSIQSFQFSIRIDERCREIGYEIGTHSADGNPGLQIASITQIQKSLQEGITIVKDIARKWITINWDSPIPVSIDDFTVLFYVSIEGTPTSLAQANCCDMLYFDNIPKAIQAINSDGDKMPINPFDTYNICPFHSQK
jgi:hypothetical protein